MTRSAKRTRQAVGKTQAPRRSRAKAAATVSPAPEATGDVESRLYQTIFDSVLSQRLKPGTKLPEASLCELFGTSRSVVRKVLQQLAHDHVVELQPNRGARIAMPSPEEAQQVFETRRALESAIVALATQRATKRDLADLRRQLGKEHSAMHTADQVTWARLASSFHHRLARLAHSPILERYLGEILSRFSLIVALYEPPDNPSCEHDEHERIVDCMERGDAAGAVRWMEMHLRDLESNIVVKRNPPDSRLANLLGLA